MGELAAELERLTGAAPVSYPPTRWGTRPENGRAAQHKTLIGHD